MGSSTVRHLLRFGLGMLFALSFCSCESGDDLASEPSGRGTLGNHQFASEVQLQFAHPLTRELVSSPVVFLSEQEYQELQGRQTGQEEVRGQGLVYPLGFKQLLNTDIGDAYQTPFLIRSVHVVSEPPTVAPNQKPATAARFSGDPVFPGVFFTAYGPGSHGNPQPTTLSLSGDSNASLSLDCSWTLPTGSQSHLLVVADPGDWNTPPGRLPLYMEIDGAQVELRTELTGKYDSATRSRTVEWSIWINGGLVTSGSNTSSSSGFYAVLGDPILQSTAVGEFSVNASLRRAPGNTGDYYNRDYTGTYSQRKLTFGQSFPDFNAEQTGPVSINNTFAWSDGGPVEAPRWEILGVDDEVLAQGTSTTISAIWDPTGTAEGSFVGAPVRVRVKVLAYRKADMFYTSAADTDLDYEIEEDFGPPGELKFVNVQLTPEVPFQNEGDSVEVTADIVAIGIEDLTAEDVAWWVDLIGPDGERVGDEPLATGDGFVVSAAWDGTVGPVPVEYPQAFRLKITATNCTGEIVRPETVRAQNAGGPACSTAELVLDLFGEQDELTIENPEGGDVLATNDEAWDPDKLLEEVYLVGEPGAPGVQLNTKLEFSVKSEKESVVVDIEMSGSGKTMSLPLESLGDGLFSAEIPASSLLEPVPSSVFTLDMSDRKEQEGFNERTDTAVFLSLMENLGRGELLGQLFRFDANPRAIRYSKQDEVPPKYRNARSGGYEILTARIQGQPEPVHLRIKNNAETVFYSGHGLNSLGAIVDFPGDGLGENGLGEKLTAALMPESINAASGVWAGKYAQRELFKVDWPSVKTMVFAGCSVFNVNDYTHEFDDQPGYEANGFEPGIAWRDGVGDGKALMLGYRFASPLGPVVDANILQTFRAQAVALPESAWCQTWLEANLRHSDYDSACGLGRDGKYWFIDFTKQLVRKGEHSKWEYVQLYAVNRRKVFVEESQWRSGRDSRDKHQRTQVGDILADPVLLPDGH